MEESLSLFSGSSKVRKIKPSPDSEYRVYKKSKSKTPRKSKGNQNITENIVSDVQNVKKNAEESSATLSTEVILPGEVTEQKDENSSQKSTRTEACSNNEKSTKDEGKHELPGGDVSDPEMPTHRDISSSAKSRVKSAKSNTSWKRNQSETGEEQKKDKNIKTQDKKVRKTPKATEITDSSNAFQSPPKQDVNDPEEKTLQFLAVNLRDYSRQRLRAVHMSLRHYSNVELRVSQKDLGQAFQENHVKLSNRIMQLLLEKFEDHQGVDFEKLYRYLTDAHTRSGRDSVLAMQCRNDMIPRPELTQEEKDNDLLVRLEDLLVRGNTFFDLPDLREAFVYKDRYKTGRVEKSDMLDICCRRNAPVYGALLKALVRRCDSDNTGMISWPEFLSFLEKAQETTWRKYPEMAELPEKAKKAQIQADPIGELSDETKSKLIGKLLSKKASLSKVKTAQKKDAPVAANHTSESKADKNKEKKDNVTTPGPKQIPEVSPTQADTDATPRQVKIEENTNKESTPNGIPPSENQSSGTASKAEETPNNENSSMEKKEPESVPPSGASETKLKLIANVKKVTGLVKTSTGFINSVKTFMSGKKKNVDPEAVPVELEEPESDKVTDETKTETLKEKTEKGETQKDNDEENRDTLSIKRGDQVITFPKPTNLDQATMDPPQERLALDWVYGYRGIDCRSNIHVLGSDDVVYFVSKIAVLYDRTCHKQRHYREHTEDIKCIAVHSNQAVIATGQFAGKENISAHIRVWRVDNLQTLFVLGEGKFEKAVMCLVFANNQDILAAVDKSADKKLTVWDSSSGTLVAETAINVDVMCDIHFNPKYPDLLVSTGKEHIGWWKIYRESGTIQSVAQPDYETYLRAKIIVCLTHNDKGDLVTGDSNGTIYVWGDGGNKITNFIKHAHDGPVFTLLCCKGLLLSGGRDGMVYCWLWNKNMDHSGSLQIPRSEGGVRMLQLHSESLLIGTTMNSMLSSFFPASKQVSPFTDVTLDPIPITQGHFDDLRGIACVPRSEVGGDFVTAGLDGIICWFDSDRRDPVCKLVLKGQQFLCVDSTPSGKLLALGTKDGHVVVIMIEGEKSSDVLNRKISKDRIDTIQFSPDYLHIAAGSHDGGIYLFSFLQKEQTEATWDLVGKFSEHKGPVNSLDFSKEKYEGCFLVRSCSSKPDVAYWRLEEMSLLKDLDPSTIDWASHHCRLDSKVVGLWWSKQAQDSEINCIDVNDKRSVVAIGDSNGYLSIFRYPCTKKGAFCHTYKSHTSIQKVLFVQGKVCVITIGGNDSCILQWRIV